MPLNLKDYEMKPLLTKGEVFDLIFLETSEALKRLGLISPKESREKNLPHQFEFNALMEQWNSWYLRNLNVGNFTIVNGMVQRGEIFQWFVVEDLLKYYESERFIIRKELYDLVERFAKGEDKPEPVPQPQAEPAEKKKNKGGRKKADDTGVIKEKIEELLSDSVEDSVIPWHIRFTRFVQNLKSYKVSAEYRNIKVPPRIKGAEYTRRVGISLDTIERIMKNIDKESTK